MYMTPEQVATKLGVKPQAVKEHAFSYFEKKFDDRGYFKGYGAHQDDLDNILEALHWAEKKCKNKTSKLVKPVKNPYGAGEFTQVDKHALLLIDAGFKDAGLWLVRNVRE